MIDLLHQLRDLIISKTVKSTSVLFLGNAVSSFLAIVFSIIAARVLGPEKWGIVAAVASLTTILVAFGDLGLGATTLKFVSKKLRRSEREANNILRTLFTIRTLTAIVFGLILILLAKVLSPLIFRSQDPQLVIFTAVGLFGFLLLDFQIVTFEARQNWHLAAFFIALANIIRVILLLLLFALGSVGLFSVLLTFSVSPLVALSISHFWQRIGVGVIPGWRKVFRRIAPFSSWMAVNRIVASTNSRVDVLLLVQLAGAYEAGIYSAANRLAFGVPIILGSFATVLAPRFASLNKKHELASFYKKTIGLSILLVLGLILGIFIAPFIISLFGPEYERSKFVLQLLLVAFIPFALSTPAVNTLIYAFQKPKIITLLSIVHLPFILLLNLYLIPKIGIFAPVIVLGLVNTSMMIFSYIFAWKAFKRA